jgi:hypothetical protein
LRAASSQVTATAVATTATRPPTFQSGSTADPSRIGRQAKGGEGRGGEQEPTKNTAEATTPTTAVRVYRGEANYSAKKRQPWYSNQISA